MRVSVYEVRVLQNIDVSVLGTDTCGYACKKYHN